MPKKIKQEAGISTAAVGGITTGQQAEEIISSDKADLVLLATQFLRDPFFVYHAALELGVTAKEASAILPVQTGFWLQKARVNKETK